ncbi:MAG TPA: hypothetical protein VEH06_13925 [Candidatus Bathyarchaeia archaeon]|nr:hypothetical protein [Candidatus Bathyarchaeia archaeon]
METGSLETLLLLENYIEDGVKTRKWLLELMFQTLDKINNEHGPPTNLADKLDLSNRRGIVQIDIIAKLMMYIEDLIIILEANKKLDGNYYKVLDEKTPDLGERVTQFIESIDGLSTEDYRKMLCYENPRNFGLDDSKTQILEKLTEWNTKELKEFLPQVRKFRKTHAQIFRRYKHAGLPIRTGLLLVDDQIPYTYKRFDSCAAVFAGPQPMNDIIILPYSTEVIQGYRHFATGVETFIYEAVENKIICLERKIDGGIPSRVSSYFSENPLSEKEKIELKAISEILNNRYPSWRSGTEVRIHQAQLNSTLAWYVELDSFLGLSRSKPSVYGNYQ